MDKKYRLLEGLTFADYAFEAFGKDLSELFVNCGIALCSCMVELKTVEYKTEKPFKFVASELDQLLHDFLEEIIFYKDAEYFIVGAIEAHVSRDPEGYKVEGVYRGEEINVKKHELHNDVKSVTYHLFKVEEISEGWRAQVILDV